ncbi:MAG: tetratricopeptide repeat protein [Nitrospirota bacterium]|nr:tetratricopeptide repeat protein [Nitrospirota bacterium]MDP2382070.1 tetratricopeptide repeat protein [Nitrospirota bacterium]
MAAWLLLLVPLSSQSPAWSLSHAVPVQQMSTAKTLTGDELLRIGEVHDHQHHFPETLTYYQLALSTFREHQQARGVATALVKIAQVYERQGKIQDADAALQEALPLFARSSDRTAHARALLVRGRVSARLGRLDNARASFSLAITLFERTNDRQGWNESLVQLGLLDVGDGIPEPGLSLLQQAWQDARTRQNRGQQLAAVVALGHAHWLLDRTKDARRYYDEGLRLAEVEQNMTIEAMLRLRLAHVDGEEGRLTEGIALGKRAVFLSQTLRDAATEATALSLLADLYRKMGWSAEAEESTQRALSIYRSRQILVHGAR